jgi:hypothetical protein
MTHEKTEARDQLVTAARQLAQKVGAPEAGVIDACEAELRRLDEIATVKQFVGLLALRHVKDSLASPEAADDEHRMATDVEEK